MTHTHFIGIGGTGLSAIARVLLERGEEVSGSDRTRSILTDHIQNAGARVHIGHAPEYVRGADVVVRSSAVPEDNVEILAARQAGIPVLKRSDYIGNMLQNLLTVAVAGAHGKTTTTSMLVWVMHNLGFNPGFIVGGEVANLGVNAAAGGGEYFVIEADEYDYMFWGLHPTIAVVTNIDHDHPDCFPTPVDFALAFEGFVDRITSDGSLVACLDDPGAAHLLAYAGSQQRHWLSYGIDDLEADYKAVNLRSWPETGYSFTVTRGDDPVTEINLQVPGIHNVRNALAAVVSADLLNMDLAEVGEVLSSFTGAGRRFDIQGEAAGVLVVDDYGHHPTEIKAVLQAARSRYPERRIWAVWQPHTYSRTLRWLPNFAGAFSQADRVIVSGVYAARENQPENFSLDEIAEAIYSSEAHAIQDLSAISAYLLAHLKENDVVIVFSAGDAPQISQDVLAGLRRREAGI